jgi:hypothetical protein
VGREPGSLSGATTGVRIGASAAAPSNPQPTPWIPGKTGDPRVVEALAASPEKSDRDGNG